MTFFVCTPPFTTSLHRDHSNVEDILFLIKNFPDAVHNIGLRFGQLFSIVSDVSLDKEIPLLLPTLYRNLR